MQLTAYGSQDLYLTGTPDTTFFKLVYKRHTNFSTEYIEQPFTVLPTFTATQSTTSRCKIDRNGDLMLDAYLVYDLPALFSNKNEPVGWSENVGNDLIYSASIYAAGTKLDIRYGQWMTIWNELTLESGKLKTYHEMIGNSIYTSNSGVEYLDEEDTLVIPSKRLYIPLGFWFCNNPGLAIPLVALQYTEIFIDIEFNPLNHFFRLGSPLVSPNYLFTPGATLSDFNQQLLSILADERLVIEETNSNNINRIDPNSITDINNNQILFRAVNQNKEFVLDQTDVIFKYTKGWKQNAYILVNYVYLSTEERTKFAQTSHEYLITQTQRRVLQGLRTGTNIRDISTLNHPVKELIWVLQDPDVSDNNDWSNYTLIADVPENLQPYSYEYIKQLDKKTLSPEFGKLNPDIIANLSSSEIKTFMQNIMYNINSNTLQNPEKINQSFNNYRDIMSSAYIKFNGIDRFSIQEKDFFAQLQKFKHHTNTGLPGTYVYSFALNPEKEQPSGTCNMSRLNNAELIVNIVEQNPNKVYNLYLYAVNYNIFRIAAGIGSSVFSPSP